MIKSPILAGTLPLRLMQQLGWMAGFLRARQANQLGGAALWQQTCCWRSCFAIEVSEYLLDHHRVFNNGDDLDSSTAVAWLTNNHDSNAWLH